MILLADHIGHRRRTPVTRVPIAGTYFSVPVLGGSRLSISELRLPPDRRWRRKLMAAIDHAHAGLPYHDCLRDDLAALIESATRPAHLNRDLLAFLCRGLGIGGRIVLVSERLDRHAIRDQLGSLPAGEMLGRTAADLGAERIGLLPDSRVPAGLETFCRAQSIALDRSPPQAELPEDWRGRTAYSALAAWGALAGRRLGLSFE